MTINFAEDSATINGEKIDLDTTSSGHYIIPPRPSQENIFIKLDMKGKLVRDKNKIAEKLHQQFGHPTHHKLLQLVKWKMANFRIS